MSEMLTQHAVLRIMDSQVIPCDCGAYRKIIQSKNADDLLTSCPNCGSNSSFTLADLAIISSALLHYAVSDEVNLELAPFSMTHAQIWKMIKDYDVWTKENDKKSLRGKLKLLEGGLP